VRIGIRTRAQGDWHAACILNQAVRQRVLNERRAGP
jgi:hypothetical protein